MASGKTIRDELMRLTIAINSDPAQKAIHELKKETTGLSEENKKLTEDLKNLTKSRLEEEKSINGYADKIDKMKVRMQAVQTTTMEQVKSLTKLRDQYDVGSKEYKQYNDKIEAARAKARASTDILVKSTAKLINTQKELVGNLAATKLKETDLSNAIEENTRRIERNKEQISEHIKSMKLETMTVSQLENHLRDLKSVRGDLIPNSAAAKDWQNQMNAVQNRLDTVKNGAKQTSMSFKDLADKFNHYSGIVAAGTAVLVGFGLTVQNIIDRNNKLIDAQTAVAKTVGMTTKEVQDLTKTFSDFDTRTSKIDLLKIAETGGRLGVQKSEIADFVQEVDKANVALGDGFAGGVEAVTNTLGKLKGLYSETKDLNIATAINQIGSAMNELGANGAASEQNIGDFAMRIGSLPEKLKPTVAEALALGAAFEEFGIDSERASSGYTTFITNAAKETDKFAKVMNISKKEVEEMLNKNPMDFFLKFAEGAKGLDTTKLAEMLEYLKMNDQYVVKVVGAASENTDRFRNSIELSNKALSEATSLQKEFDKVNNNSAAIYEKVQKNLAGIFANESVAKGLNFMIEGFGKMIGAIEDTNGNFKVFGEYILATVKILTIAVVAMYSYNTAIMLTNLTMGKAKETLLGYTVVQKVSNLVNTAATTIQKLLFATYLRGQIALAYLTGNTVKQTVAQRMLNAVSIVNPWLALAAVIATITTAYFAFRTETNKLAEQKKILNKINEEGAKSAAQEVSSLDLLYKTATNVKLSTEERLEAVKKLQDQYPAYFADINSEIIMNGKAKNSYLALRDAIVASARASAAKSELESRAAERLKRDAKIQEELDELKEKRKNPQREYTVGTGFSGANEFSGGGPREKSKEEVKNEIDYRIGVLNNYQKKLKETDDEEDNFLIGVIGKNANQSPKEKPAGKSNYNIPGADADKDSKAKQREAEKLKRLQEQHDREMDKIAQDGEKAAQLARQIALDTEDAKIEAMQEGFEKEMAELNLQEQRRLAAIDKQKVGQTEIDNLQKKIDKAKGQDKILFQALMDSWKANNEALENEKIAVADVFELKRETIQHNEALRKLKEEDENFQASLKLLKRQGNEKLLELQTIEEQKAFLQDKTSAEELTKITTLEEGKAAIEKYYKAESLKRQVEFLKQKEAELSAMVAINAQLGVLDPNQVKTIEEYKNQISELLVEIDQLKTGKTGKHGKKDKEKGSLKGIGGETDLLGLTPDQWETMFSNNEELASGLDKARAGIVAMQNAYGMYFQFVEANQKRELQRFEQRTTQKKNVYKQQLLDGYINQETYKKLSLKADQDLDKKKAEMALKAAQRERQMQIMSIIGGTASAVVGALGNKPWTPANFVLAGIVGAIGAVQLATTLATPLPTADGYEDGFGMEYPIERAQDGKKFNVRRKRLSSGLVDRPTHFIAGENDKVEMVIDNPTWTSYPDELKRAIYSANARAKGFENGFNTIGGTGKQTESNDDVMIMLISTVNRMNTTLDNIEKNGIQAKIAKTARNGKEVQDMQKMYDQLNNKNKHG